MTFAMAKMLTDDDQFFGFLFFNIVVLYVFFFSFFNKVRTERQSVNFHTRKQRDYEKRSVTGKLTVS